MARDIIHDAVKEALINDGWIITDDPYTIKYEDATVFADLAAEKVMAAEKAGRKIIVEIKSFVGQSAIQDFKEALGQYQTYLPFLHELGLEHKLYLAVTDVIYEQFFERPSIRLLVKWHSLSIMVVDIGRKEIVEWIN
jgi:hypothetical protein